MAKYLSACLILVILLPALILFSGCDVVTGSGETSTFEMAYTDFTRLEIGTGFDVEITRADTYFVEITVDKSLYEYLSISPRGDTLRVSLKDKFIYTAAVRKAVIQLPDLRRLELSGGSKAVVTGFNVDHVLDFELSGASKLILNPLVAGDASLVLSGGSTATGYLEVARLNVNLSGGSTSEFTGNATQLKVEVSGGSTLTLEELPVPTADIELSGASHAIISVSDLMDLKLSGASRLDYIGSPKFGRMDMSGGSTLNPL